MFGSAIVRWDGTRLHPVLEAHANRYGEWAYQETVSLVVSFSRVESVRHEVVFDKQDFRAHQRVSGRWIQSGRAKVEVSSDLGRSTRCSPVTAKYTISPTEVA